MTDAEKHVWENGDGDLVVLVGSREYVIEDVDAATGLWVQEVSEQTRKAKARLDAGEDVEAVAADLHLDDDEERNFYQTLLGGTLDELVAAGVKWRQVRILGQIAYAWITRGLEGARKMWEADGEAPKANRAQRRAKPASGSKTKTGGASASTTKRPASTRGTKTRT
jgi:hypothetical protein